MSTNDHLCCIWFNVFNTFVSTIPFQLLIWVCMGVDVQLQAYYRHTMRLGSIWFKGILSHPILFYSENTTQTVLFSSVRLRGPSDFDHCWCWQSQRCPCFPLTFLTFMEWNSTSNNAMRWGRDAVWQFMPSCDKLWNRVRQTKALSLGQICFNFSSV